MQRESRRRQGESYPVTDRNQLVVSKTEMTTQDRRRARRLIKGRGERLGFGGFRESHINQTEWKNFIAGIAEVFSAVPNGEVTKETAMKRSFDWQAWIDRNGVQVLDRMPKGWNIIKGATHYPRGYVWASNGRSLFDESHNYALVRVDAAGTLHSATCGS